MITGEVVSTNPPAQAAKAMAAFRQAFITAKEASIATIQTRNVNFSAMQKPAAAPNAAAVRAVGPPKYAHAAARPTLPTAR